MPSKAEKTSQYILEKVAPVFNRRGYVGTSLSDITEATGLTKGAVYGNFKNKEDLAIQSFNFIIRNSIGYVSHQINKHKSAKGKLKALTTVYKRYYDITFEIGGCPIINMGSDANNQNPIMMARVTSVINKLVNNIAIMIRDGQEAGEFKKNADAYAMARRIYSTIQGSIFTSTMMKDEEHMPQMMLVLEEMIERELYN